MEDSKNSETQHSKTLDSKIPIPINKNEIYLFFSLPRQINTAKPLVLIQSIAAKSFLWENETICKLCGCATTERHGQGEEEEEERESMLNIEFFFLKLFKTPPSAHVSVGLPNFYECARVKLH